MIAPVSFQNMPIRGVDSQIGKADPYTKRGSQESDRPLPLPESIKAR